MAGGIATEQAEYAWAALSRIQARLPGQDVEVHVRETLCLGEQRDVGLGAAQHLAQRRGQGTQQRAKVSGFLRG